MGTLTFVVLARRLVSLTLGAEDGIRTRDPNLGKVAEIVRTVLSGPLACSSVRPVSSPSTEFAPVVERSTTRECPRSIRKHPVVCNGAAQCPIHNGDRRRLLEFTLRPARWGRLMTRHDAILMVNFKLAIEAEGSR
jgi:hypothetical protein